MATDESSTQLVERWRRGDEDAATELYRRYLQQLLNVVNSHLTKKIRSQVEPDDIVQSTCRSFFIRLQEGRFEFQDDDNVWKLMVTVALNKLRNRVRYLEAEKRDVGRQVRSSDAEPDAYLVNCLSRQPSLAEAAEFHDLLERIRQRLEPQEQQLLQLRLEGYSQQEIAEQLGLCTRTVRRMNDRIRGRAAEVLGIDPPEETAG